MTLLQRFDRRCVICAAAAVEPHHVVSRSQGGGDGPTIEVCSGCHRHFTDEEWEAYLDADEFGVVDKATGVILWQQSLGVDGKRAFVSLHTAREALEEIPQYIPYLYNEQLVELFKELRDIGKRGWAAQCAILGYAFACRFVHGDKVHRLKALGGEFGVSVPTLYGYIDAWTVFRERLGGLVEAFEGKTSYIIEAARHPEQADELIGEAIEEYHARPYPLAEFRARIRGEDYKPRTCPWWVEGDGCERYKSP